MPICAIADLRAELPTGSRLLGLDLGSKTIGLAISDTTLTVASPIGTVQRTKLAADARELAKVVKERGVGGMILGLPLNMNGSEGPSAQSARQFAANLIGMASLFACEPLISFWDERLSSCAVNRLMIDADLSRRRRAKSVDTMAAAYILQGALDALTFRRTTLSLDDDTMD